MSTTTQETKQIVDSAVREISHIATLPEVTVRIIELVEDPTSTAKDLHTIISNDPALCSRILKVVNSSFYGMPGQIGSINRAIVLLGLNAVKNIAISASLAKLFRGGDLCPNFGAKDLWVHSVAVATGAKSIAEKLEMAVSDQAFLAGLIHDIGVMVELQLDRNKLIEVVNALECDDDGVPTHDMLALEEKAFGANHQQFGFALTERWKFPVAFRNVCGHHHDPAALPEGARQLAQIIYVADRIAAEHGLGFALDLHDRTVDPGVLEELGLSAEQLDEVRTELPEGVNEMQVLLG